MSTLTLQSPSIIVLAGPSGVGKSTWAHRLFPASTIVSSDECRKMISDDPADQSVTSDAFSLLQNIADLRLKNGRSVVIDSTALVERDRLPYLVMGLEHNVPVYLVTLTGDHELCMRGQKNRDRQVPEKAVLRHVQRLENMLGNKQNIEKEGFAKTLFLSRTQADEITEIKWSSSDKKDIDVISDVHGCAVELQLLLEKLGYELKNNAWQHPDGRLAVFVGDLTDRGPYNLQVLDMVNNMIKAGSAQIGAIGNHDWKLYRWQVIERDIKISHGLEKTVREIEQEVKNNHHKKSLGRKRQDITKLVDNIFGNAPACSVYDDGKLVVTHGAVIKGNELRRNTKGRRDDHSVICMFGQTAGMDENNRPIRIYDWVDSWDNTETTVMFGHDVVGVEVEKKSENVWAIDTGCVFGGRLTAVRWPSKEIVQVDALMSYDEHENIPKP